jgi:tRNA modification GTPase
MTPINNDTICAISTAPGVGGIAVIRISGPEAVAITDKLWKGRRLTEVASHTAHLGTIIDSDGNQLDQAVATLFLAPRSFTGEDVVELSVHGSRYIQQELIQQLIAHGCRLAEPGEFTRRAFANGRMDLAEAEAVADVIASSTRAAHRLAISQMRGDFSRKLNTLHDSLLDLASLLELELDFSEEDVEFASRQKLLEIASEVESVVTTLAASFAKGSAIKDGIPVAIVGDTNAGKSTLLNALLHDDRAIVSDIHGTTRDTIEDTININGTLFRLIDTAGIRETHDTIEALGIERTLQRISSARIVLWVIDATTLTVAQNTNRLPEAIEATRSRILKQMHTDQTLLIVINKTDLAPTTALPSLFNNADSTISAHTNSPLCDQATIAPSNSTPCIPNPVAPSDCDPCGKNMDTPSNSDTCSPRTVATLAISAREGIGIDTLQQTLVKLSGAADISATDIIVTNARHYEALTNAAQSIHRAIEGIHNNLSGDFIAQDVRETLHHLASITGTITSHDILTSIFSRFCIGK